jgi:hypothetical protein
MTTSGAKQKLTIYSCTITNGEPSYNQGGPKFEFMINPSSYQLSSGISYRKHKPIGGRSEEKYDKYQPETFSFKEFILDGTGVVKGSGSSTVTQLVTELRAVAYDYVSSEKDAPVVYVSWGPFARYARLESLNIDYTLFKPSGEPLRAKVSIGFRGFRSSAEITSEDQKEAAEQPTMVTVEAGDSLPDLCQQMYGDPNHYLEIARINNLKNFRDLKPGTVLTFPPAK